MKHPTIWIVRKSGVYCYVGGELVAKIERKHMLKLAYRILQEFALGGDNGTNDGASNRDATNR